MNLSQSRPCSDRARSLAARHPSDLSSTERAELQAHVQICPSCSSAYAAYALMETAIRALPSVMPLAEISPELLEEKSAKTAPAQTNERMRPDSRLLALPRRSARSLRLASLFAAVLVVCALIAGSVVLFTHHDGATQVGTGIAPTSDDPAVCNVVDPGLQWLCSQGQLTSINATKIVAGVSITLKYAYADRNRITVLLSFQGPSPVNAGLFKVILTTPEGQVLEGAGDQGTNNLMTFNFDPTPLAVAPLPGAAQPLNLNLQILPPGAEIPPAGTSTPVVTATPAAVFKFVVPFHEARTATLVQSQTIDGNTLTLDRVVVAPSSVYVYLRIGATDPDGPGPFALKAGSKSVTSTSRGVSWSRDTRYTSDSVFLLNVSLYNQQGPWTFTFTLPGVQTPYVFHFTVPSQA